MQISYTHVIMIIIVIIIIIINQLGVIGAN